MATNNQNNYNLLKLMKGKERHEMRMCRFSMNIRGKKKSSDICALAGLEAYTEQLELQKFCQHLHVILYLVVWLDKFNYNCLAKQLLQLFQ